MDKFNKLALLAVDHQQKGRFGEAKIIYNELLNIQEKNPQILRLLGMVEYELKNYLVSLEHLSKSIEINPNDSETYTNRGMVNVKLNNIEQEYSTVTTWDSFESVADAIKFMNGEFSQPQVRNSKMTEIMPDGFTARVIVTDVMWAVD